ncbi:MAG: histidinol phosphatase [Bacteroidetes bacterium]|nr:histidinol phosphatase [Bacteroidota bacterium]
MLNLFKRKTVSPDLSFIGVDMHSHLLPGLDDGLKKPEETIAFIRSLKEMGYHKLICTPHILAEVYPNSPETILPKLELIRKEIAAQQIDMQIDAAAEYMVDIDMEKLIDNDQPLLTFGDNHILIEMSYIAPSSNIEPLIFKLRMKGYQPVLAHPERYNYYHTNFEMYERFIDLGCLLQVNLLSLLGYYGKSVKKTADLIVEQKMVSLLGTDMHHQAHLDALKDLASKKLFYSSLENCNILNKELFG